MKRLKSLFIINRFGGLIYFKHCETPEKLVGNANLKIGSLVHSLQEMSKTVFSKKQPTSQFAGRKLSGFSSIETESHTLYFRNFPVGIQIFVVTEKGFSKIDNLFREVYSYYCNVVAPDNAYHIDMPIKSAGLDELVNNKFKEETNKSYFGLSFFKRSTNNK